MTAGEGWRLMSDELDWNGWDLTRQASEAPPVEWLSDCNDDDLTIGYSMLRALAADPDSHMVEIAPHVFYDSKLCGE